MPSSIEEIENDEKQNKTIIRQINKVIDTVDEEEIEKKEELIYENPMIKTKEKKPRSDKQIQAFNRILENNKIKFLNKQKEKEEQQKIKIDKRQERQKKREEEQQDEDDDEDERIEKESYVKKTKEKPIKKEDKIIKEKVIVKRSVLYF
jgi:hypothetical protein